MTILVKVNYVHKNFSDIDSAQLVCMRKVEKYTLTLLL